jgi:GntR family transcriptional regulator
MTQPGGDTRRKYQRIADDLRERIVSGEFSPGDKLPGENELMQSYDVARMTARQALDVLRHEGLTVARRGSGVYVRDFKLIRRSSPARLRSESWTSGTSVWSGDVETRPLEIHGVSVTKEAAPEHVARVLDLDGDKDHAVYVRRRTYVVDERPVNHAVSYFPADLVAGSRITEEDTGKGGVYARLAELDAAPARFREEVRSRSASADEATYLQMQPSSPVLAVARTAFTEEGRPVELNEMVLDPSVYVLDYEFDA